MAAKSTALDGDILKLLFNGTPIANIADNAASSPLTSLYCALHSSDPTVSGTQSSNEVSYGGYDRVAVARTSGAWTVTGNSVSPAANISFPLGTSGAPVATYMSIGVATSGASKILYYGALIPPITCGSGISPLVTTISTVVEQ